jgi:hypothetical protein
MWILPLLIIGLVVIAAGSGSPRSAAAATYVPELPPGPPTPIQVFNMYVERREVPPPPVILCAIAEAQSLGRDDVASNIMHAFVVPVVQQAEFARAMSARPAAPYAAPQAQQPQPQPHTPAGGGGPAAIMTDATDAQIQAALNADPRAFIDRAAHGKPVIDAVSTEKPKESAAAAAPAASAPEKKDPQQSMIVGREIPEILREPVPVPVPGLPIDRWETFRDALSREAPDYASNRAVGQYRQRRERLLEIGIDPEDVLASPEAQEHAIAIDLADALERVREGNLDRRHVGRLIWVPGCDDAVKITLSGLLGVVQAAGLDHAEGWLHSKDDRKRFPHTTAAFMRTNGVF